MKQIHNLGNEQTEHDFKNHNDLLLARIKRIIKSDEDVRMISAEAPVLFAKACELFILDLSIRSWNYSQLHKRITLQKEDVKETVTKTDIFDFLMVIPAYAMSDPYAKNGFGSCLGLYKYFIVDLYYSVLEYLSMTHPSLTSITMTIGAVDTCV